MAANSYYSNVPTHPPQADLGLQDPYPRPYNATLTPLKPMLLSPHYSSPDDYDPLEKVQKEDETLKRRIRILRVVSRVIACAISLAALVPMCLTLQKFLKTQNVYREVSTPSGFISRTAWSRTTKTWPTWMYFSIALSSFVLNLSALIGYFRSVKTANITSTVATVFSAVVMVGNIFVWAVTAALYKYEKEVPNAQGKHDDLWGWTCSGAAEAIQKVFEREVSFDRYCSIQTAGWYAGLIQCGAGILSAVIFLFAWRRMKVKKAVRRSMSERLVSNAY